MSFSNRLARGPCLLWDGGMGTLLMARGLAAGEAPERWNLERPEEVRAAHADYVAAGCDVVQTNTFGAHPLRLERFGFAERCEEIATRATALARSAAGTFVVGDLGPVGELLPPVGTGDPVRFRAGYLRLARALAEAGCDALHVETQSDLAEARIALSAALEAAPGLPVLVSLAFERRPRGFFTVMGNPLLASLDELARRGASAVGANCSLASGDMAVLGRELLAGTGARTLFQPNAGRPEPRARGFVYTQEPREFAADLAPLAEAGAAALGGCCGTDPRFLRALRDLLDEGP